MKNSAKKSQSGMSMIEILLVMVIIGIVVTFALITTSRAQNNINRQNLAREFKNNLERARFDSVKRRPDAENQMSHIIVDDANSYRVFIDMNQNGTLDNTDVKELSLTSQNDVKIVGNNLAFPVRIYFDRRGAAYAKDNNGNLIAMPTFIFCEGQCTAQTANVTNSSAISISSTGTIAMLNGGESVPTFGSPNVSTTAGNSNTNVSDWVSVSHYSSNTIFATPTPYINPTPTPTNSTPTPTPQTATPTPTVNPNTTPTPTNSTPTPTPTPTISTPTPTPTITACTSGQRPAQSNCQCVLPMTVQPNGKCMLGR